MPRMERAPDPLTESVSLWFRLLSCHAVMLGQLRRELEAGRTVAAADAQALFRRRLAEGRE